MQRPSKNKIVIGVTGSFGSGKSTVAGYLSAFGAKLIDADKLAHQVIASGKPAYGKILRLFGKDILKENREIDRRKLGGIVFRHRAKLKQLNRIIHPQVIRAIKQEIISSKEKVVVVDAPLIFETGLDRIIDKMIVVRANRSQQLKRLNKKLDLKNSDILNRIRVQMPLLDKVRKADFVIDNTRTRQETKRQVNKIRRMLWRN